MQNNTSPTGPFIGFAGAVFTDRPNLHVLTPVLPSCYHATNTRMREMTARCFGAAKMAISWLREYYERNIETLQDQSPTFPHPHTYESLSQPPALHSFKYEEIKAASTYHATLQIDKLVFRGKCGNEKIFIKFVRRYSKDAHMKCSELKFAPSLRALSKIPKGWYMVVMDYISDDYEELDDARLNLSNSTHQSLVSEIREQVKSLHAAGFVHGDIRSTNVIVKKNGRGELLLIDFDWAGESNKVKYPMNINRNGILQPEGARDGALITPEHDMYMVDKL